MKKLLIIFLFFSSAAVNADCYDSSKNLSNPAEVASVLACMQYEINQLKKGSGNSVVVNTLPGIPDAKISATQTVKGMKYDLESCKRNGRTLTCSFIFTSLEEDFYGQVYISQAYDELGGEYETKSPYFVKGGKNYKQMMAKVPVQVIAEFKDFDAKATQLVKLKIRDPKGTLEFSNIAIK